MRYQHEKIDTLTSDLITRVMPLMYILRNQIPSYIDKCFYIHLKSSCEEYVFDPSASQSVSQ